MTQDKWIVEDFMTRQPYTISRRGSILEAQRMMAVYRIRHLPIMSGKKVYGIVSDRDIKMALGFVDARPDKMTVSQIGRQKPYMAGLKTPLAKVADTMARRQIGCALIHKNRKLVGIFTTVDACKALSKVLRQRVSRTSVRVAGAVRRKK